MTTQTRPRAMIESSAKVCTPSVHAKSRSAWRKHGPEACCTDNMWRPRLSLQVLQSYQGDGLLLLHFFNAVYGVNKFAFARRLLARFAGMSHRQAETLRFFWLRSLCMQNEEKILGAALGKLCKVALLSISSRRSSGKNPHERAEDLMVPCVELGTWSESNSNA